MALHAHPEWRERLRKSDEELDLLADEVRRFILLFPSLRNHSFERGEWVLFDIFGTNHDLKVWEDPMVSRPKRFRERNVGPYDLVSHEPETER
jgi:fatty-acid peroxygenase